jgi:hypothetical protein
MSVFNQTKAAQKAWEYRHYGKPVKYMEFEDWFAWTLNKITSNGAKVGIQNERVFIKWPGQQVVSFPVQEFETEYWSVYRGQKRATA